MAITVTHKCVYCVGDEIHLEDDKGADEKKMSEALDSVHKSAYALLLSVEALMTGAGMNEDSKLVRKFFPKGVFDKGVDIAIDEVFESFKNR